MSLAPLLAKLGPLLEAVIGIGILVFVHELGHFIAAKLSGVRVEKFSVGFGPRLLSKKVGETDYRLSLVPWGGYVALSGESPAEAADDPRALSSQPARKRAFVFISGVTMNLVFGIIFFILAFRIGVKFSHPTVGSVKPASPAWRAGIERDDVILEINRKKEIDFEEISAMTALTEPGEAIHLKVKRGEEIRYFDVVPIINPDTGLPEIGIEPKATMMVARLLSVDGLAPAKDAGIRVDDKILGVDGSDISSWSQFQKEISLRPNRRTTITILRGVKHLSFEVTPIPQPRWMIGIEIQASTKIQAVKENSLAQKKGFEPGQRIEVVNSKAVTTWEEFIEALQESAGTRKILITVGNHDEKNNIHFSPSPQNIEALITSITTELPAVIESVHSGYPAQMAGLAPGDRIVKLGPEKIGDAESLIRAIQNSRGEALEIVYQRGAKTYQAKIEPVLTTKGQPGRIGLQPKLLPSFRQYGWLRSIQVGFSKTKMVVVGIYLGLRAMITRRISARQQLGGPITIAVVSYYSASESVAKLLYIMGIISVGLVFVNLLPLPVLDGGLLLLLGIEKLKGSPVSQRTQEITNYIGWALIITLMLWVTFFDIMRLKEWSDKGLF